MRFRRFRSQVAFKWQTLLCGATTAGEDIIRGNYEAGRCQVVSIAGNLLRIHRLLMNEPASQQINILIGVWINGGAIFRSLAYIHYSSDFRRARNEQ